jgi:hypothetical protein
MVDIHSIMTSSRPSCREHETEGEVTSRSRAGRPHRVCGVFATLSHHPRDDVAASQTEARGDCCLAVVSPSPRFSPADSLP